MKKLLVILISLICNIANSQSPWILQNSYTSENLTDVFFLNEMTGFVSGDFTIYKTTNGGYTWSPKILPDTTNIKSIRFLNNSTGYACGGRFMNQYWSLQHLFKTTNGGENWLKIFETSGTMTDEYFSDVYPIDSMIFLAKGGYAEIANIGGFYRSTNNGLNFTSINITNSETFGKISFVNSQTGWLSTSFGTDVPIIKRKVFKTTNAGLNWIMQFKDSTLQNPLTFPNFELQFLNQNIGYGMYRNNYNLNNIKLIRTTNGGTVWDSVLIPYALNRSLFFANDSIGWITGMASSSINIIRTSNKGINWHVSWSNNTNINSIYFVNSQTGWAVGDGGIILRTFTSGLPGIGVQNISTEVPNSYSLSQNYPNPFNPRTKIRFAIPNLSFPNVSIGNPVLLKVYDIRGCEVQTLVNEKLNPGTYETTFDGSNFSSGVYFYRLITDGYSETKRMLLIK